VLLRSVADPRVANVKILRAILLALLFSLLFGLLVGTIIRLRLERPQRYMVWNLELLEPTPVPQHLFEAHAPVLDACHHEQEVG